MELVLESILINTYNPDNNLRAQAEASLAHFLLTQGALPALLNFVGNTQNHRELRQATGIVIKNQLRDFWRTDDPNDPLTSNTVKTLPASDREKEYFKDKLVEILLIETDNSIRGLLAESIRVVSEFEYPDNWSTLLPQLLVNLQQSDVLRMYNSLLAIRKLIKRYEYKPKEKRQPLHDIIQASFSTLENIMTNIISLNSIEAAQVMKVCLKIFYSATIYKLPTVQGVNVNLWFSLIGNILEKHLPEASEGIEPFGQPIELDDRKSWPWWKLKKWAIRIVCHFIQRYGNPRYAETEYKQFAEFFRANTASVLLNPILVNLSFKAKGGYITDDLHRMCISYVSNCVEMSPTYKILKPNLDFILFEVIFPTLCLSDADMRLFEEDPKDFVRKIHDPMEDWLDPTIAATNLLQMLARYRQKDVMPKLMPFIQGVLQEYSLSPIETRDYRKKDGILVTIAVLAKILKESPQYSPLLSPFLTAHVIPEFQSPIAFIRARACWVIEYFDDMDWNESDGELLKVVLQGLISGLRDPAIPVQAAAACSLRLLIQADGATELLKPILPVLVGEYFRIMDEVDNESVLTALQAIVDQFGVEIADMAVMMVEHLVTMFNQYSNEGIEDDEAAFTATQCLDTIGSVMQAIEERPDVILQLEPYLIPLIHKIVKNENNSYEYIDCAVQMLGYFTYFPETISNNVWSVCGPLLSALYDWAIDYVTEIMNPILNYITKGIEIFLGGINDSTGEPFIVLLLKIVEKIFLNDISSENQNDSKACCSLLCCVLISSKDVQLLKPIIPQIITLTVNCLNTAKSTSLKHKLLEVIMSSLYYNPGETLQVLFQGDNMQGVLLENIFLGLFSSLKDMERTFTQRLIVLSFISLLSIPISSLPAVIQRNASAMFQQIIREITMIDEEEAKEDDDEEGDDDDDDDDGDEEEEEEEDDDDDEENAKLTENAKLLYIPEGGYGEDEDCINAEDETYREALEKMDKEDKIKHQLYMAGEPVDDEEEDDDYQFTSPIENIDLSKQLVGLLGLLSNNNNNNNIVATLQSSLDQEDQLKLQTIIQKANNVNNDNTN
eukprot:gene9275-12495_t